MNLLRRLIELISGSEYHQEQRRLKESIKRRVKKRDDYTCQDCGRSQNQVVELHVHHIKPRSEGGSNHSSNLITLCDYCHKQRHPDIGFLQAKTSAPGARISKIRTVLLWLVVVILVTIAVGWVFGHGKLAELVSAVLTRINLNFCG